jgi:hypothetical protein
MKTLERKKMKTKENFEKNEMEEKEMTAWWMIKFNWNYDVSFVRSSEMKEIERPCMCIYVWNVYVYIYIYINIYVYRTYIYVYRNIYIGTYICVFICEEYIYYTYMYVKCFHLNAFVYAYAYLLAIVHIHIFIYTYTY